MSNKKRDITEHREAYKPFEYPELDQMASEINHTYWIHDEIDFTRDKHEFLTELSEDERYVMGTILKTFTSTEMHIGSCLWSAIYKWMPKPEVYILGTTCAENEVRHMKAYDKLNDVLGLTDYESFLEDEVATERFENLMKVKLSEDGKPEIRDLMLTLAVFSGLAEYVNLFSQFMILSSFSSNGRNYLTNIYDIINWSGLDERAHAEAGFSLLNILKEENPDQWDDEMQGKIYTAAILTYDIEKKLIDQIFLRGDLPNLTKKQIMNYMSYRINDSLVKMGLKPLKEVDPQLLKEVQWFEDGLTANSHSDFFAKRVTDYTKNLVAFTPDTTRVTKDYIKSLTRING